MKLEFLGKFRADQFPDPIDSFSDGIIKIVDNRNPKSLFKELNDSVAADESSPTGNKNAPF